VDDGDDDGDDDDRAAAGPARESALRTTR